MRITAINSNLRLNIIKKLMRNQSERVTSTVAFIRPECLPPKPPEEAAFRPATANPVNVTKPIQSVPAKVPTSPRPVRLALPPRPKVRPMTGVAAGPRRDKYERDLIARFGGRKFSGRKISAEKENTTAGVLRVDADKVLAGKRRPHYELGTLAALNRTNRVWPPVLGTKALSPRARMLPSIERPNQSVVDTKPKTKTDSAIEYELGKSIGQGAYAVVKEAVHRGGKSKFAIKVYEKYRLLDPQRKKCVSREISILKKLSHPNIVKLYETIDTTKQLMLVMELVKGRSMHGHLKGKEGRRVNEEEARGLLHQIVDGIHYCHQRNVSHRDIKMENLLLDEHENVKIIDFGFATCVPEGTRLKVFCGTPSYMAPEIVNKREYYGPPADMWAIGVLMYAMICGTYPFKAASDRELYRKISKGVFTFPVAVSVAASDLITRLLQVDPKKRPTSEEVLHHRFFEFKLDGSSIPGEEERRELYRKYDRASVAKIVCSTAVVVGGVRI